MSTTAPEAPFSEGNPEAAASAAEEEKVAPLIDGEVDAMMKMGELIDPFPQEVQLRMLKYFAARCMNWSGCRIEKTDCQFTEIPTGEYA
jgi:hypothetical protein